MAIKKSLGEKVFDNFNNILLTVLMFITIYPFIYVLFASISSPAELMKNSGLLFYPKGLNFIAYIKVFQNENIVIGYQNTFFYVIAGTAINVVLTVMAGYVLSRRWLYGRNILMMFVTFTMFFSGGLIPNYLLIKDLGLIDSRWALIIPNAINVYNIIITRTFFFGIPESLEESAKIDGATDMKVLFRIIIPLSMPIMSVNILFYAVAHWNSWFNALIYIKNRQLYPLQMFLREILIQSQVSDMVDVISESVSENIKYAVVIVSIVPILCVYPFLQKYFTKGVMVGAVKG